MFVKKRSSISRSCRNELLKVTELSSCEIIRNSSTLNFFNCLLITGKAPAGKVAIYLRFAIDMFFRQLLNGLVKHLIYLRHKNVNKFDFSIRIISQDFTKSMLHWVIQFSD